VRQITAVLIFGPPGLAILTWFFTRAWTRAWQGEQPSAIYRKWQRFDFWIILISLELVMLVTALIEHKL
jgi:hypothetical protein